MYNSPDGGFQSREGRKAMFWTIVLIIAGVILLVLIISFIYLMKISRKEGPEVHDEKYWADRRKEIERNIAEHNQHFR